MPRTYTTQPGPEPRLCETHDVLADGVWINRIIECSDGWSWLSTNGFWKTALTRDDALITAVLEWAEANRHR